MATYWFNTSNVSAGAGGGYGYTLIGTVSVIGVIGGFIGAIIFSKRRRENA